MGIPFKQAAKIGSYVVKQHLTGVKRYPLVLMLEPLFRLQPRLRGPAARSTIPTTSSTSASLTTSACRPSTSAARRRSRSRGGEPLLHREMPKIVEGFLAKDKFVILCTNALLLTKKIEQYKPHPNFTWSIHLDGDKAMHDHSVCLDGVYEKAIDAIKLAKAKGFRTQINCTLFSNAIPERVAKFFDLMTEMGLDGITISPGYAYERAPDQESFLNRERTKRLFRDILSRGNGGKNWSSPSRRCSSTSSPATRPMSARRGRCRCVASSAGRNPAISSAKAM